MPSPFRTKLEGAAAGGTTQAGSAGNGASGDESQAGSNQGGDGHTPSGGGAAGGDGFSATLNGLSGTTVDATLTGTYQIKATPLGA